MVVESANAAAAIEADVVSTLNAEPHEMRVTDHGRIHSFVAFALKFLQENPQRPLVLHTLPRTKDHPIPQQNASAQSQSALQPERDMAVGDDPPAEEPVKKKPKIMRTTSTIPRLVSVVEIIKREYAKEAAKRRATDDANGSSNAGLHQYNELSTLEDLGIVEQQGDAPDDAEQLRQALEGKNFLKQKLTPHLKVTLSVKAQPMLEAMGATHQPPLVIKKTKSARARERRRHKKQEAGKVVAA